MKANDLTHKACDNCTHFTMHYYRSRYRYWVAEGCGFCKIKNFTEEERAKLPFGFVCDSWAHKAAVATDISEIKEELRDITARLIFIVNALSK